MDSRLPQQSCLGTRANSRGTPSVRVGPVPRCRSRGSPRGTQPEGRRARLPGRGPSARLSGDVSLSCVLLRPLGSRPRGAETLSSAPVHTQRATRSGLPSVYPIFSDPTPPTGDSGLSAVLHGAPPSETGSWGQWAHASAHQGGGRGRDEEAGWRRGRPAVLSWGGRRAISQRQKYRHLVP